MATNGKPPRSGRERTNESLRRERQDADREQLEKQAAREKDADRVVHVAREKADAVLDAARGRADQQLEAGLPAATVATISNIFDERVLEDAVLQRERARADQVLRDDRLRAARSLATLLAMERERTDLHLLTERARSDSAIAQRDDFLGMVSHDLRNLLNGIVIRAGVLADKAPGGEGGNWIREETDGIHRYAARMDRLIGDLVDVVSIDAGKLAVTRSREDCTALIDETMDNFHPIASGMNISLTKVEGPSLVAELDRQRILQVLANLITNSIKFSAPGRRISAWVEREGDEARFCVRDNGSGIPPTMLKSIFERFWQIGKNDRRGLGLGLYICKCIVEAHGGRIWAESQEGEGSRFFFTIPVRAGNRSFARGGKESRA